MLVIRYKNDKDAIVKSQGSMQLGQAMMPAIGFFSAASTTGRQMMTLNPEGEEMSFLNPV